MHCLAAGENDDAEPPPARFLYVRPPPYTPICLLALVLRTGDYPGNPGLAD